MKLKFWDVLSILVVIATIVVLAVYLVIYINPSSPINPFPFPTVPSTISVPSLTPTRYLLPATWTPTPRIIATPMP